MRICISIGFNAELVWGELHAIETRLTEEGVPYMLVSIYPDGDGAMEVYDCTGMSMVGDTYVFHQPENW